MQALSTLDAIAAALPIANVDTDKILPARFLKTITREGLGDKLFWSLRQDPGFMLNRAPWDQAGILIALDNFGCGSSREHAPWALLDFGIRCIIAPSIADIFHNNCFKNGILPIVLPHDAVTMLIDLASQPQTARLRINLPDQCIATTVADQVIRFDVDAKRKADLIEGVDEIARTLGYSAAIGQHQRRRHALQPWLDRQDARTAGI